MCVCMCACDCFVCLFVVSLSCKLFHKLFLLFLSRLLLVVVLSEKLLFLSIMLTAINYRCIVVLFFFASSVCTTFMIFLNLGFFSSLLLFILKCSTFRQCSTKDQLCYATFVFTFLPNGSHVLGLGWSSTVMAVVRSFTVTSIDYNFMHIRHAPMPTLPRFLHPKRNFPLQQQICKRVPKKRHKSARSSFAPKSRNPDSATIHNPIAAK